MRSPHVSHIHMIEERRSKKAPEGAFLFLIKVSDYLLLKSDIRITNTTNPINPPFTSEFTRVVKLATTSNPKTDVPVNTNHNIATGIIPINTDPKPETKSFTIENTFFMSI